ncbi:N-ethylammeline chlorohydrolase [Streptococcus pneumoniae]|nr:N-ethylammeline chlorohydrolase [Streptococcus pneumoniae]
MKIKEQTRKLATGCSKHCFEVVYRTDEVSNHTHGKAKLTWFDFRCINYRKQIKKRYCN